MTEDHEEINETEEPTAEEAPAEAEQPEAEAEEQVEPPSPEEVASTAHEFLTGLLGHALDPRQAAKRPQRDVLDRNAKAQRLSFVYEYDNIVNTYTTKVSNSYGYSSEATYDLRFGQLLSRKDLNGNEIVYEIDDRGRISSITGP